ncbi:MAG TPA: NosD domain-containing protein [Methanoregulaceae archaeon]|nr:NosD domain-containing protein [Methanoregulaceae archaeon]
MLFCLSLFVLGTLPALAGAGDVTSEPRTTLGIGLVISQPGSYTLDHDLAGEAYGVAIESSDVLLDGMGHAVTATNGTAVYLSGSSEGPISNVTVRNLSAHGSRTGVYIGRVNGTVIEDVLAEQNGLGLGCGYAAMGGAEHVVVRDSVIRENEGAGISLSYPSDGVTIEGCTVTRNGRGIESDLSGRLEENLLVDSEIAENAAFGVSAKESGLVLRGCTVRENGGNGIELEHARAEIFGNRIETNAGIGVSSSDRGASNITSNVIAGNGQGVSLGGDWASRLVNNHLDNIDNGFFGPVEVGMLNITKSPGPNIVGGPFIGGNYWAHPNGTGFSQTHPDTDGDGFCDEPYVVNIEEGVTDHLPLAMPDTTPGPIGGDKGYFLVSTVPAGAQVFLVDLSGTRYPVGNTSAGALNVTVYLTATPIRAVVATLPGYKDAVFNVTQYPPRGGTIPVSLVLEKAGGGTVPYRTHEVPCRVEAEDYDLGGEGVAYHDTTPGNAGGAYRSDDVDIERTAGLATPNIGWIRNGEHLCYTVNVSRPGDYLVSLRVASPNSAQFVEVDVDGARSIAYRVPNTGSFGRYVTVTLGSTFDFPPWSTPGVTVTQTPMPTATGIESQLIPFYLSAGTHVVTLQFKSDGQNIDWLELTRAGTTPTPGVPYPAPHSVPGRVESEDYDTGGFADATVANEGGAYRNDAVDIERGGSNFNVGWIRPEEYLVYSVDTGSDDDFVIGFRVANPGTAKRMTVSVNDAAQILQIPSTGSFGTWTTVTLPAVRMHAGRNTVRVETGVSSSFNLDYMEFRRAGTQPPTTVITTPTTPAPSGGATFTASPVTVPKGGSVKFSVIPASGKTVKSAWWSFDAVGHMNTWNSRVVNPSFYYPAKGTFSPLVKLTYTDGSTETVQRTGYVRAT